MSAATTNAPAYPTGQGLEIFQHGEQLREALEAMENDPTDSDDLGAALDEAIDAGGWNHYARRVILAALTRGVGLRDVAEIALAVLQELCPGETHADHARYHAAHALLAGDLEHRHTRFLTDAGELWIPSRYALYAVHWWLMYTAEPDDDAHRVVANQVGDAAVSLAKRAPEGQGIAVARAFALAIEVGLAKR